MTYIDAVLRLANHANLGDRLPMEESLLGALWIASKGRTVPDIGPLVDDVISCLEVVNQELNGHIPSETTVRLNERAIGQVAYPISLIVGDLLRPPHRADGTALGIAGSDALVEAAFRINSAWCQVLAGDIDDIRQELEADIR